LIDRYKAVEKILDRVGETDLLVSTTGMISREVFATDDRQGNFYMIGSMGLASSLALGLALLQPQRPVFVLDGDGSALMSLGALPLIGSQAPRNLVHVILDNETYESTGAQPSISPNVSLSGIGKASGYATVQRADDSHTLEEALLRCGPGAGPHLIVVKAGIAPVDGIPRVSHSPEEIRDRFRGSVQSLRASEGQ
jgi:phosphonopyruvate decarboxylase